jgi:hypothetical protein
MVAIIELLRTGPCPIFEKKMPEKQVYRNRNAESEPIRQVQEQPN